MHIPIALAASMAFSPLLTLWPLTSLLQGYEMIDASCSARPVQEATLTEVPTLHNQLARRADEKEAIRMELEMVRAEANEVAEENRIVREALDDSRLRLSEMAEELAATRAALRARDLLDLQNATATPTTADTASSAVWVPAAKSKHAGGGSMLEALFGCAGGREAPPKAYAVTLHPALPQPQLPLSPPKPLPPSPLPPSPPPRHTRPPPTAPSEPPSSLSAALLSDRHPSSVALPPSPGLTPPHHDWYSPSAWAAPVPDEGAPFLDRRTSKKIRAERREKAPSRAAHKKRAAFHGSARPGYPRPEARNHRASPAEEAEPQREAPQVSAAAEAAAARALPDGKAWMCGGYDVV